jgi:hypothetical protein
VKEENLAAAEALDRMGSVAGDALPALEDLLESSRGTMREERVTEIIESILEGAIWAETPSAE